MGKKIGQTFRVTENGTDDYIYVGLTASGGQWIFLKPIIDNAEVTNIITTDLDPDSQYRVFIVPRVVRTFIQGQYMLEKPALQDLLAKAKQKVEEAGGISSGRFKTPEVEAAAVAESSDDEDTSQQNDSPPEPGPVSYTHLTLPTICSV